MSNLLEVKDVTRTFGALKALDGVSLSLRKGEILGIAGPNGSGKSTLFNVISGIPFHATTGLISYDNQEITRVRPHEIYRAGLARTFQKDCEFSSLSVRDNVLVGAHFGSLREEMHDDTAIEYALDLVGVEESKRSQKAENLSVFDKKRVMIASSVVSKPKLLMLDEPASGLTKPEVNQLCELILTINRTGVAILVIEHVIALLLKVAPRLLILNEGKLLAEGTASEIIVNKDVIEAYLGGSTHP